MAETIKFTITVHALFGLMTPATIITKIIVTIEINDVIGTDSLRNGKVKSIITAEDINNLLVFSP